MSLTLCKVLQSMHHESEQARLLEPLSTKWIEDAAGVSRDTVAAWRRGRKPRTDQWEKFTAALDAWRAGLPDATKEPPPEWAGAMEARLQKALEVNRVIIEGASPEEIAAVKAELDALRRLAPPPGGSHHSADQHPRDGRASTRQ